MMGIKGQDCVRKKVQLNGENYYLIVGKRSVEVTVPHENRPNMAKERMIIETLCQEITAILGRL